MTPARDLVYQLEFIARNYIICQINDGTPNRQKPDRKTP